MAHTEEILRELLNKVVRDLKYENHELIIKEISSGGANYTSKLFTVVLKGDNKDDLHLFAKVMILGEKMRIQAGPGNNFDTEQFAHTEMLTKYAALEEESGVPEEQRLIYFTKCYGVNPNVYQESVVLDNLFAHGYDDFNRFRSMDWDYAAAATTALATMHALSFAYSTRYPEEFKKTISRFTVDFTPAEPLFRRGAERALENVKPEYVNPLKRFFEKYSMNPNAAYAPVGKLTIIHGDYRGNNLMHRVRDDGKVDIKIVDLQTLQGGSPVTDLMYFIFTGSDEQFRAQYYDKLIDHYYTQLSAAMKRLNLDPEETFSRADFDYELEQKLPFGLTLAVFTLPVVTVESENAPKVIENLDMSNFSVEKTSDLYAERLNGIVKDFVKWGILK